MVSTYSPSTTGRSAVASMGDDYLHRVQEARLLGRDRELREQERCRRQGITPDMKTAASEEMAGLYVGLEDQTCEEQLRRYDRLFECAQIRGYFYDPDPAFDLLRIQAVTDRIDELRAALQTSQGLARHPYGDPEHEQG